MKSNIIGIDLAKDVFHICVMSKTGKILNRKKVSRNKLVPTVETFDVGVIAMESCSGAHYWSRLFRSLGYETRMIAAQFVKPFLKSNKNDSLDAEAICEAASRAEMRFVPVRSEEQQDLQNLHRIRERLVKNRTGVANEIRGLLLEYGITVSKGINKLRKELVEKIEAHNGSGLWKETFMSLYEELVELDKKIVQKNKQIKQYSEQNETCQRLKAIPGVGVLGATAMYAAVGDAREFKNGRHLAAWVGLVPKQHSTGGKARLGKISKRGNKYLRTLLVLGARSNIIGASSRKKAGKSNVTDLWFEKLIERRGSNRATVALANKMARRIWVVLSGREYRQSEVPQAILA